MLNKKILIAGIFLLFFVSYVSAGSITINPSVITRGGNATITISSGEYNPYIYFYKDDSYATSVLACQSASCYGEIFNYFFDIDLFSPGNYIAYIYSTSENTWFETNFEIVELKCSDGTIWEQCSTTKPKLCSLRDLINRCSTCGCPSGETCQTDGSCAVPATPTCSDGTFYGQCSTNAYFSNAYCNNQGQLVYNNCYLCGCSTSSTCGTDGWCTSSASEITHLTCSDGTLYGQCSSTKPKYCVNGNLIDDASACGCPAGYTSSGDSCIKFIEVGTCGSLIKTDDASKNVDIVFLSLDKIGSSNLNEFQLGLNEHINLMLSIEPFKSKKDYINFYFLKVDENFWDEQYVDYTKIYSFLARCEEVDEVITLMNQGGGGGGAHFAAAPYFYPLTTVHEFGHSFGGLVDTYVHSIFYNGDPGLIVANADSSPNIDNAGCPKWCQSNTGPYQTACTLITNEQECRHHERTLDSDGKWSCQKPGSSSSDDISKCCVWLSEPDPFFGTKCVNFRDEKNIGVNCVGNSGCFYGAFGSQTVWRSVGKTYPDDALTDSIMNIGGGEGFQEFGIVEVNIMNKIFDCCYPRTLDNFPQQECQQLASKYSAFSGCYMPNVPPPPVIIPPVTFCEDHDCGSTPADTKGCFGDQIWTQSHKGKGCDANTQSCYDNGLNAKVYSPDCTNLCENGECTCKANTLGCLRDKACCSGVCSLFTCKTCRENTDGCLRDNVCCSGICSFGKCKTCRENTDGCLRDNVCCSGICSFGKCKTCRQNGDSCLRDAVCCSGSKCFSGTCQTCIASGTVVVTIGTPHRSNCCNGYYCSARGFLGICTQQKCT
jgi:hypothetical protein